MSQYNNNVNNMNMNTQYSQSQVPLSSSSSQYTTTTSAPLQSSTVHHHHTTAAPLAGSQQLHEDTNDLSKPSFFKSAVSGSQAALNSSSASSLLSSEMGSTMTSGNMGLTGVVRDPLSLSDIEQRGGLHSGLPASTATQQVLSTLKNKENEVLLGAQQKIHELQQKEQVAKTNVSSHGNIADIQRKDQEEIARIAREKELKIQQLKQEEAAKIADIQRREQEQIQKLQQQKMSSVGNQDSKIHDIAVDAKQKLDQVRLTEEKVVQNLTAAEQLRAMAHEREVLAEKQNAESIVAQTATNALHPTTTKATTSKTSTAAHHTTTTPSTSTIPLSSSSSSSTTAHKLEQHERPIVQQTTTQTSTVQGGDNRYTRGA